MEPEEPSSSHPCEQQANCALLSSMADRAVSLWFNFKYPPEYPDVLPEMSFEAIDEESGELRDGEEETLLEELRKSVSLHFIRRDRADPSREKSPSGWP